MELAIQRLAAEHLRNSEHLHPDWPLEREYPLQANLLVVSRLWRDTRGQGRLAAKGAPEAIADLCHLTRRQPGASNRPPISWPQKGCGCWRWPGAWRASP